MVRPLVAVAVAAIGIEAGALNRVLAAGLLIDTVGTAAVWLQAVPLRVNAVGTGLAEPKVPLNPVLTVAPVPRVPFHAALETVTCWPLCAYVAVQAWVASWAESGESYSRFQLLGGSPELVMAMLRVKPPGHWLWPR